MKLDMLINPLKIRRKVKILLYPIIHIFQNTIACGRFPGFACLLLSSTNV